jgi:methylitaconate Delta-isomerase
MWGTRPIDGAIIRGGTSKGVYLREGDVPPPGEERDRLLLRIFGSPDLRQIDGLGGAEPLTSKCVLVGPGDGDGVDLRYTFAQVEIGRPHVDYGSVCGNLSAGLGYLGIHVGYLRPDPAATVVRSRVHVVNNGAWLEVETPVRDGLPLSTGEFRIAGVPGTGAEVVVNLAGLAGARLGEVLPTGQPIDVLDVPGHGPVEVTLIDVGNPHVFLRAADLGLAGTESAATLDADAALQERLELIRSLAAERLGMASSAARATQETPAAPILGLVAAPRAYETPDRTRIDPNEVDLLSRLMFMQRTHKTYAGTSTACTGVAVRLPGTIPASLARVPALDDPIRIGHPSGVVHSEATVTGEAADLEVTRATVSRTARIIMTGQVHVPR